jgi:hypothetical protein
MHPHFSIYAAVSGQTSQGGDVIAPVYKKQE